MTEQDRASVRRDVNALVVASVGGVVHDPATSVVDAAGLAVPEIGDFLASMMAGGASPRSVRSYGWRNPGRRGGAGTPFRLQA